MVEGEQCYYSLAISREAYCCVQSEESYFLQIQMERRKHEKNTTVLKKRTGNTIRIAV